MRDRPPRPIDLARQRRARRRRSPRLALWVPALAVLAAGGWGAFALRVERVRIDGLSALPADLVARVTALDGGERILLTRMDDVRRRIEGLPSVRRATVRRSLPSTVVVSVEERVAVVRLEGRPGLAADSEGRVFPASAELPHLAQVEGRQEGAVLPRIFRSLLSEYARFPLELRREVVRVRGGHDVLLVLRAGTEVRFGRPERLRAKAASALAVLADARKSGLPLDYVDVRSPRTPVAGRRPQPAPATPRATRAARADRSPAPPAAPGASARPAQAPRKAPSPRPTPALTPPQR